MSPDEQEDSVEVHDSGLDVIARKMRLYLGAAAIVVTTVTAGGTWAVQKMTAGISARLDDTHDDLSALAALQARRFEADSIRTERAFEIVELISAAVLEKEGSSERSAAIAELRHRRHVIPN